MSVHLTILAIDSSTGACSVAIARDGHECAHVLEAMTRGQSERLAPMVESALLSAGISMTELDAVAVTRGPGSFTGLRIGLAFAKGLGQALGVPVIAVTGFEAVARAARGSIEARGRALCVVLESRRAELYLQIFGSEPRGSTEPSSLLAEDIPAFLKMSGFGGAWVLAGDAAPKVLDQVREAGIEVELSAARAPDARDVAALAHERGLDDTVGSPRPFYLRGPDVSRPKAT